MASAGAGATTLGLTPPNGDNAPVTENGPTSQGPSEEAVSAALAAASERDDEKRVPPTPEEIIQQGVESVRENIHPFFKALHNILKIFRFLTPRGVVEWFVKTMKKKREMSQEATPA